MDSFIPSIDIASVKAKVVQTLHATVSCLYLTVVERNSTRAQWYVFNHVTRSMWQWITEVDTFCGPATRDRDFSRFLGSTGACDRDTPLTAQFREIPTPISPLSLFSHFLVEAEFRSRTIYCIKLVANQKEISPRWISFQTSEKKSKKKGILSNNWLLQTFHSFNHFVNVTSRRENILIWISSPINANQSRVTRCR